MLKQEKSRLKVLSSVILLLSVLLLWVSNLYSADKVFKGDSVPYDGVLVTEQAADQMINLIEVLREKHKQCQEVLVYDDAMAIVAKDQLALKEKVIVELNKVHDDCEKSLSKRLGWRRWFESASLLFVGLAVGVAFL